MVEETDNQMLTSRESAYLTLSKCAKIADDALTEKIERVLIKIKNEYAKKELLKAKDTLLKTIPSAMAGIEYLNEEGPTDFMVISGHLNDWVFGRVFKVIINILDISSETSEGEDRMSVHARNFSTYCKYQRDFKNSGVFDNPAECIFKQKWKNSPEKENFVYTKLNRVNVKPKYFFIFDFISDSRNLVHQGVPSRDTGRREKDLLTGLPVPGNYFTFTSIYLLSLYAFEELLDLMEKYL